MVTSSWRTGNAWGVLKHQPRGESLKQGRKLNLSELTGKPRKSYSRSNQPESEKPTFHSCGARITRIPWKSLIEIKKQRGDRKSTTLPGKWYIVSLLCQVTFKKTLRKKKKKKKKDQDLLIRYSTNRQDLHCHSKEFVFSCRDDNIGRAQGLEIVVFAG